MTKTVFPRLHAILARDSPGALVIRRGPSRLTAVIGWDRAADTFQIGQWFKGKLYPYRSDISPDGKHWIYFAMSARQARTWTVAAKVPYLKALDFYEKHDAWNGGGLFLSNKKYWLNETREFPHVYPEAGSLEMTTAIDGEHPGQGEDPPVYFRRLLRDGWSLTNQVFERQHDKSFFDKPINGNMFLEKIFHGTLNRPLGKSPYYEEHRIMNKETGETRNFPDWEWADVDGDRLVWAEHGTIMAGRAGPGGILEPSLLFDTNPLVFSEIKAPY